ncbi:hypothetical protein [Actinoallomurus sp. CA-150999]|uniref:hypothetical protein n=1 Tax=Actinoallomurus sp. CA-150999 TaxID=3239887 RepID=UPI003D92214B
MEKINLLRVISGAIGNADQYKSAHISELVAFTPPLRHDGCVDYDLTRLGSREFEHLTQALAVKIFGHDVSVFGDGPDGGREASFYGETKLPGPNSQVQWNGYVVLQAKFRVRPLGVAQNAAWFLSEVRKELSAWGESRSSRVRSERLPEYLIIATNVVLSPVADSGGIDRANAAIENAKNEFGLPLKGWAIWHYDQICTFLDIYPEIRQTYGAMVTPGDVLAQMRSTLLQLEENNGASMLPRVKFYPGKTSDVVDARFADEMKKRVAMHHALTGRGFDAIDFWRSFDACLRRQGHDNLEVVAMRPYHLIINGERWHLGTQWADDHRGVEVGLSELSWPEEDSPSSWIEDAYTAELCAAGVSTHMAAYAEASDRIFVFRWERDGSEFVHQLYELPRKALIGGLREARAEMFRSNKYGCFEASISYSTSGLIFTVALDPNLWATATLQKRDCVNHGSWVIVE